MGADNQAERVMAMREQMQREIEHLKATNAKLRAALKPFADYADSPLALKMDRNFVITQGSPMARRQLTMGDCLNALVTLKPTSP